MTIEHSSLTDPELHEPKGVSAATSGQVYTADGAGSGDWTKPFKYIAAYSNYSTGSPYVHSLTTGDTVLDPTLTSADISEFTLQTVPNARLRYDGTETIVGNVNFNCSFRQSDGADRAIQWVIYKNGSSLNGSRIISTTESGKWVNITVITQTSLATNDYIEVFAQGASAFSTDYAKIHISIEGHVV